MRRKNKIIKKGYMIGLLSVLLVIQACGMEKSDVESESGKQSDGIEKIENESEAYNDTKKNDQEASDQTEKEEWMLPDVLFEDEPYSGYNSQNENSQSGSGLNSKGESQSGTGNGLESKNQSGTGNGSESKNQEEIGSDSENSSQPESSDNSGGKGQTGADAIPDDEINSETGQMLPDDIF